MTRLRRNLKGRGLIMKNFFSRPNLVKSRTSMRRIITRDKSPNMKAITIFAKIKTIGCAMKSNVIVMNMKVSRI